MQPDTKAAVDFLNRWSSGPHVLTAITPDKKSIITSTFTSEQMSECYEWIDALQGERNIYFHVNPCMRVMHSKAEREDVKELAWLHVDIDPRAGEDIEDEQARALATLQSPPGLPLPTVIIFSGGGYQAFWKLREPLPVNGDLAIAEDAKLWNQQLEVLFGADNCHNIDRIMRLPGTLNIPDQRKLQKGRKLALARLIEFHDDRVYDLSQFPKCRGVQLPTREIGAFSVEPQISENLPFLESVDELDKWGVPDRIKVIIVTGHNEMEGPKQKDNSRSAWLFDALCGMARCNVPQEVMFAVVTDPSFEISSSVRDKGTNAEKYAKRQIQRACEEAIDPNLREMNEAHAVIENYGGRCLVMEELDGVMGPRLAFQSFSDINNRYCNRKVVVGTDKTGRDITIPLGKWWLTNPARRQFRTVVFSPGRDIPGAYNLWKGFACESRPGDCSLFLEHVRQNICQNDEGIYQYVIGWMARAVQYPDSPGHTAIVMRGEQGTGKGCFAKHFGSLFGRHFQQISDPKHLVGNFNFHLQSCVVVFADESFFAGDKKHEAILKALITEETMAVERKGIDVEVSANYIHLIMASNSNWVVPSGPSERRYLVLDVQDTRKQDSEYFDKIKRQMNSGGREGLLYLLSNYDLSNFEVRKVPRTKGLRDQQVLTLASDKEWWLTKLNDGRLLKNDNGWRGLVPKSEVFADFIEYARDFNITRRGTQTSLGRFLSSMIPGLKTMQRDVEMEMRDTHGRTRTVRRRVWHFHFPPLDECRAAWEKLMGGWNWPDTSEQEPSEEQYGEIPTPF
jgi:hypothetical protein